MRKKVAHDIYYQMKENLKEIPKKKGKVDKHSAYFNANLVIEEGRLSTSLSKSQSSSAHDKGKQKID